MANISRPTPQQALRMRRDAQARIAKCDACGLVVDKGSVSRFNDDPKRYCVGEGTNDCYGRELERRFREAGL